MQKSVSNFMKMAVTLYKVCWAKLELKLSTVQYIKYLFNTVILMLKLILLKLIKFVNYKIVANPSMVQEIILISNV